MLPSLNTHALRHRMEKWQMLRKKKVDLGGFRPGTERAVPLHTH